MIDYSTIYKYRNFENPNHKRLLVNNELFLANPTSFNDPFDCRIPLNLELLDTDSKRWKYAERIYNRDKNNISKNESIKQKEIVRFCKSLIENPLKFQESINKIMFETQDNILGIISFSFSWDSLLLWSHYSDSHKGICVGFNREKLENSKIFYCGGAVNYNINFPLLDPLKYEKREEINNQVFLKSKEWEYELEYRLVKIFDSFEENRDLQMRKIYIPNDFFSEIILGYNFPDAKEKEIFEIARIKKIPVYRSIKQKDSFTINKIKIYPTI